MNRSHRKVRMVALKIKRHVLDTLIVRVGSLITLLAVACTFALHHAERVNSPEAYGTYGRTVRTIMVLFLSGFDVAPPQSTLGWTCAIAMLCFGLGFIAVATGEVASFLVTLRIGGNRVANIKLVNHTLICGWSDVARDIVQQLLSDDIQDVHHIVIIDEKVTETPYDDPYVYFVPGVPASSDALTRANAREAATAIILADNSLDDANLRDSKSTLATLAVKSLNPKIYTCVELMRSENIHHLKRVHADEIICVSEMSRGLIAQSAVSHGLSRFFSEVLSFSEGSEIYKHRVPRQLAGKTFHEMLTTLSERQILVLSVERNGAMHTNPEPTFRLQADDSVFALADDESALTDALAALFNKS